MIKTASVVVINKYKINIPLGPRNADISVILVPVTGTKCLVSPH